MRIDYAHVSWLVDFGPPAVNDAKGEFTRYHAAPMHQKFQHFRRRPRAYHTGQLAGANDRQTQQFLQFVNTIAEPLVLSG